MAVISLGRIRARAGEAAGLAAEHDGELRTAATVVRLKDATARVQHPLVAEAASANDKDLDEARRSSSHHLFVSSRCWYTLAMGRRNYLISGVSGAGKTAVCTELQRRGYQAINGDEELAYQGDPDTGQPTDGLKHEHSATFISEHHIWDVEKVKAFVASQDEAVTFFCGGSRNFSKFIELFDGVFVLEIDLDTSLQRIDERVTLDPNSKEGVPKNGIIITAPLARVVDEVLR
jgi:hypothetical protein